MQAQLDLGGDAEVAAAASQAPEELLVTIRPSADDLAGRGEHLGAQHPIAGEAELRGQVADPTAQREAGDPGRPDHASWGDEAVGLRRAVEVQPGRSALRACDAGARVDVDPAHQREVDDEPVVDRAVASRVVAASPDGDLELVLLADRERGRDVVAGPAARDQRRTPVDERVVRPAQVVVAGVGGTDHGPVERAAELRDRLGAHFLIYGPGSLSGTPNWVK